MQQDKRIIGITGRAGTGKSQLAEELTDALGARLISLDAIGHECLKKDSVIAALSARHGAAIVDDSGQVQRRELGRIIFENDDDRQHLNKVMHPKMNIMVREQCAEASQDWVIIEGALIQEIGLSDLCDRILVVDTTDSGWESYANETQKRAAAIQRSAASYAEEGHVLRHDYSESVIESAMKWIKEGH